MKKIYFIPFALIFSILCSSPTSASSKRKIVKKRKTYKKEQILSPTTVASLIAIEAKTVINDYLNQDTVAAIAHPAIISILHKQPSYFDKNGLLKLYVDSIDSCIERKDADGLIQVCATILVSGHDKLAPIACEGIVQAMAQQSNTEGIRKAIRRFELLSKSTTGHPYDTTIRDLRTQFDDVINPVSFEDKVKGTWVSAFCTNDDDINFPYIIFDINYLTSNTGIRLHHVPGMEPRNNNSFFSQLLSSQFIGGEDGHIQASFGTEKLNRGNDKFAQSGFETTRNFRAESRATISSSNAKFGDKLLATAATETVASLLDAIFMSTAKSSKQVAVLNLDLNYETPNVLNGRTEYYNYSVNVDDINKQPIPKLNQNLTFIKWEPKDSVFFVDSKQKIHSVSPLSQLDLKEYNEIMYNYSWKRPKYLIPSTLSIIGGVGLMTYGIICLGDLDLKDDYGNIIYEGDHKKLNSKKMLFGVISTVCGALTTAIGPGIISGNRIAKRSQALGRLNNQQSQKLRKKQNLLSLSPLFEPTTQSFGLNTSITF